MCDVPFASIVVAKQAFVSQTASIATTTIYTPTVDGDYEVSIYAAQDASLSGNATVTLSWTDEYSSNTFNINTNPGIPAFFNEVLHIPSGNAIDVAVLYSVSGTHFPYDVFVTITKK